MAASLVGTFRNLQATSSSSSQPAFRRSGENNLNNTLLQDSPVKDYWNFPEKAGTYRGIDKTGKKIPISAFLPVLNYTTEYNNAGEVVHKSSRDDGKGDVGASPSKNELFLHGDARAATNSKERLMKHGITSDVEHAHFDLRHGGGFHHHATPAVHLPGENENLTSPARPKLKLHTDIDKKSRVEAEHQDKRIQGQIEETETLQHYRRHKTRLLLKAAAEEKAGGEAGGKKKVSKWRRASIGGLAAFDVGGVATHFSCAFPDPGVEKAVDQLELMIANQVHSHEPSIEVVEAIRAVLADRPEWRNRMAVLTTSPILRQVILQTQAPGARIAGSSVLGATHPWRSFPSDPSGREPLRLPSYASKSQRTRRNRENNPYRSDHNWPEVDPIRGCLAGLQDQEVSSTDQQITPHLPKCPIEQLRVDPTKTFSQRYSFPKDKRKDANYSPSNKTHNDALKVSDPGPGAYGQFSGYTGKLGLPFKVGEQVVLGANHTFQFKRLLGYDEVTNLSNHASVPVFSFPKSRRTINEVQLGKYACVNSRKTDAGPLNPGMVYEHYSTFFPNNHPKGTHGRSSSFPARAKSQKILMKKEEREGGTRMRKA
ncbi:unnamed protein product [Amoebophrya sp. A120]|nr:unnamed protein product [Amoebophrya sp. A120]|eukprot:GSA120T00021909001.1